LARLKNTWLSNNENKANWTAQIGKVCPLSQHHAVRGSAGQITLNLGTTW